MERKENEHEIRQLKELSTSDFEIKDGQPDIIHWKVLNSDSQDLGTVTDLLFDETEQKVRYLVLNLEGNIWNMAEREVLIPIGVAELDAAHDQVILPNITAQQLIVLPDYIKGHAVVSADSELYGHKDFDESNLYARRATGSYEEHIPFQVITRIYQEENEAENAFVMLIENGFSENDIKVTPYNPLNSVTDLAGNTNTEFIGDGSRDEYILSIAAASARQAELALRLLDPGE
ncbi:MAG: PRC-barrel domain-containing protein [Pedobacter sp.]|uniref:PRC-barrel domain-containing protein n=1 Tax=Pedobacter sp. TaxID=1411316 RepID=UPI003397E66D